MDHPPLLTHGVARDVGGRIVATLALVASSRAKILGVVRSVRKGLRQHSQSAADAQMRHAVTYLIGQLRPALREAHMPLGGPGREGRAVGSEPRQPVTVSDLPLGFEEEVTSSSGMHQRRAAGRQGVRVGAVDLGRQYQQRRNVALVHVYVRHLSLRGEVADGLRAPETRRASAEPKRLTACLPVGRRHRSMRAPTRARTSSRGLPWSRARPKRAFARISTWVSD